MQEYPQCSTHNVEWKGLKNGTAELVESHLSTNLLV